MSETQNFFLNAINVDSEKQENITENEWNIINQDKDRNLAMISNSNLKKQFESKYQELDVFFKQE
jgi:hypothetical protein